MQLRPYQIQAKRDVYRAFKQEGKKNVMLQLATGGGKTIIFNSIINDAVQANRRVLVLAHRQELIMQAHNKLYRDFGLYAGVIMSGHASKPFLPVQVASVQTLVRRAVVKPPDIVIIDEAHHMQNDNTYGKIKDMVLEINPDCMFLGVTATPIRTNGAGFKKVFDIMVQGVPMHELIKQEHLTPPKYYVAPLELGNIKISAGDYNLKELSEAYQKKVHPIDLVDNWKKLANGLQTIGFAVDIEHSKNIVAAFNEAGIKAAHIDGKTDEYTRINTIKQFEKREITVLYNVGVFDEGFDAPLIEAVQFARPTKSLIKYMQMGGRALRPYPGKKHALILDHAGLVAEHDLLELERDWTLEGVSRSKSANKETCFRDTLTGKTYKPKQLPLDIPMSRIELILLDAKMPELKEAITERKLFKLYMKSKALQERKNAKVGWIWYLMAKEIKDDSTPLAYKDKLYATAKFYCAQIGYSPNKAHYMVEDYLKKININKKGA